MSKPCIFKKLICALAFAVVAMGGFAGVVLSEPSYQSATKTAVITVPDGQVLHTLVTTPINSKYVTSGQTVTMTLGSDFCYNSRMVAPVDSMIYGNVIKVSKGTGSKPAELMLRFNNLITPYGIQIPISAIVNTADKSGIIKADDSSYFDDKTGNIDIPVAADMDLILIQPITVNPEVYNSNY